jgi:type III restriction enzyme
MDKGAHFYKTDFQVHTPRDPGWIGDKPVTNTERIEYAKKFVRACRERAIQAVAITDHHDLAFFPFIRDAAEIEQTEHGLPIPSENRLLVFPGIELTLAIPCQALLIFDATLPNTVIGSILPHFGIASIPDSEPSGPQPTRLSNMMSFQALYERLNENANLKGRFIVLPHVQDKGHETLLRSGFAEHYKKMPCVGGYLGRGIPRWASKQTWGWEHQYSQW